ncbi:MAG: hypothetical protein ACR2M0_09245 [Chloroflexia bacterium]
MGGKSNSEYEKTLLLEDMESLAEEMDEIGVAGSYEVMRWLAVPRTDERLGVPGTADEVALKTILDMMEELGISTRAELANRIRALQEELDWPDDDA